MNLNYVKCSNRDFPYFGVGYIKTTSMQKPEPIHSFTHFLFAIHTKFYNARLEQGD